MAAPKSYLRANTMVEPLVDGWYAWAHLIPPATAARNLTQRYLKIMDSYIESPETHASAVKNPALLGGPFMDFDRNRVEEVSKLREQTLQQRTGLIRLSRAIEKLDCMLQEKAKGYSMEPLYAEIPEELQGYVELVYDLNNQPSFRLIEPLLYHSEYYNDSMQSLLLSEIGHDDRPFALSTPRLSRKESAEIRLPFKSPELDLLFRAKNAPVDANELCERLRLSPEAEKVFRSFLTTEAPKPYQKYSGPGARWRYFGHACILLETPSVNVLLDPVLSYTYESEISRYTYEDLPPVIDYVLITHDHQDHILFETLLQLRPRIRNIVVPRNNSGSLQDPSLRLLLQQCGFRNVIELDEMDQIEFDGGSIMALPFLGEHGDLNIHSKAAWRLCVNDHVLLFAADSCNIDPKIYRHVHQQVGDAEVLFIGMECNGAPMSWLYGSLLTRPVERSKDHSRRLAGSDFERAKAMVDQFGCKEVYVYAMGQEPWLNYVMSVKYTETSKPIVHSNQLVSYCQSRGIEAARLFGEKEILLP